MGCESALAEVPELSPLSVGGLRRFSQNPDCSVCDCRVFVDRVLVTWHGFRLNDRGLMCLGALYVDPHVSC